MTSYFRIQSQYTYFENETYRVFVNDILNNNNATFAIKPLTTHYSALQIWMYPHLQKTEPPQCHMIETPFFQTKLHIVQKIRDKVPENNSTYDVIHNNHRTPPTAINISEASPPELSLWGKYEIRKPPP